MHEIAAALRRSWLFEELPIETLLALADACTWARVHGGQALFRQGEGGDAMFVVASGRLQVLHEAVSERRRVALLGPGDHVGDYALLTGDARSATVAALRDSRLVRIDRTAFERFVAKEAGAALRLATRVIERHRPSHVDPTHDERQVRVVALVPTCEHAGFTEVCTRLERTLTPYGEVARLEPTPPDLKEGPRETGRRLGRALDALEEQARFVLVTCGPEPSDWSESVVRQADAVIVVGLGDDPAPSPAERRLRIETESFVTRRIELLRVRDRDQSVPTGTRAWHERRRGYGLHHARLGDDAGFARLARRLAGYGVGLALGGIGVHAFGAIGVSLGAGDAGLPLDAIAGSSTGAAVAALLAAEIRGDRREEALAGLEQALADALAGPLDANRSVERLQAVLDATFGDRVFEDLEIPCYCVASDLDAARPVTLGTGPIAPAVLAAMAIPALHPAQVLGGRLLADGAILSAVPADLLRERLAGLRVLAVDAHPRSTHEVVVQPTGVSLRLFDLLRQSLGGASDRITQIHDALLRSATLAAAGHARATLRQHAAFVVELDLGTIGTLERGRRRELLTLGLDAVRLRAAALRSVFLPPRRRSSRRE